MSNNATLCLYNDEGETVFCSNDYKEIGKFLDRNMSNTYTTIFRIRRGEIKHIYDKKGNRYTAEIIDDYPTDIRVIIDMAIEYIYDHGIVNLNGYDLLKILEGHGSSE